MNLPRSITVTCSAIALALSGNRLSAKAATPQPENSRRIFADWCRYQASFTPEAKNTVEVLLQLSE
jgi:internalin A